MKFGIGLELWQKPSVLAPVDPQKKRPLVKEEVIRQAWAEGRRWVDEGEEPSGESAPKAGDGPWTEKQKRALWSIMTKKLHLAKEDANEWIKWIEEKKKPTAKMASEWITNPEEALTKLHEEWTEDASQEIDDLPEELPF